MQITYQYEQSGTTTASIAGYANGTTEANVVFAKEKTIPNIVLIFLIMDFLLCLKSYILLCVSSNHWHHFSYCNNNEHYCFCS